jgi:hypothetical protein
MRADMKNLGTKAAIAAAVTRHLLTGVGGVLVATGVLSPNDVASLSTAIPELVGAVSIIAGIGWSAYDKVTAGRKAR